MKLIVDPGSCHMAKLDYAKELIDLAAENKCHAIKFQLFWKKSPNIPLPREWWGELVDYAKDKIIIFSSVSDIDGVRLLEKHHSPYVKFSYSMRKEHWLIKRAKRFSKVIVSCFPLEAHNYEDVIKLFCIPEYPVLYEIDFREIFKTFDGFSDHTLGVTQTLNAIKHGAKIIEKHITLDHKDINCPDHYFALKPLQLKELARKL